MKYIKYRGNWLIRMIKNSDNTVERFSKKLKTKS